jgi:hypothetical protein
LCGSLGLLGGLRDGTLGNTNTILCETLSVLDRGSISRASEISLSQEIVGEVLVDAQSSPLLGHAGESDGGSDLQNSVSNASATVLAAASSWGHCDGY